MYFYHRKEKFKKFKKQLHSWAKVGILATGCRQRIRKMTKTIQKAKENFAQASVVIKVAGSIEPFSMYIIWYIIKKKFLIVHTLKNLVNNLDFSAVLLLRHLLMLNLGQVMLKHFYT